MDDYSDMIALSRPQYDDLPPMPVSDRAAQFSPFAALVGYDDAVDETARLTDSKSPGFALFKFSCKTKIKGRHSRLT